MNGNPSAALAASRLYDQALVGVGGTWGCDLSNQVLTWGEGVYDLFGLRRGSVLKRSDTLDHYQSQSRIEMERHRAEAVRSGKGFSLDCQIHANGQSRWMRLRVGVGYEHGRPIHIFGTKQDVTAEKAMWDGLVTLVGNDPLTGLANRRAFEEALRELSRHAAGGHGFAVAVISIDDLESIREQHDYAGAQACLRGIGERLARLFPDAVLVSRIGGGEFALLLHAPGGVGPLAATLQAAHALLARPVPQRGTAIGIGVSIGATLMKPSHRHDPKKLFAEADAALYVARAAGHNRLRIFDGMITARVPVVH